MKTNPFFMLIKLSWSKGKVLCVIEMLKSVCDALIPLITIQNMGYIIEKLQNKASLQNLNNAILKYVLFVFSLQMISIILHYFENKNIRKVSNVMQMEFTEDIMKINYHYVQDGTFMNMRKKSMRLNPAMCFSDFAVIFKQIIQFIGIAYIFLKFSPLILIAFLLLTAFSTAITFKNKNLSYELSNKRITEDRKIDYLYKTMTESRYAKEIRINKASDLVKQKYESESKSLLSILNIFYKKIRKFSYLASVAANFQNILMYSYFTYEALSGIITIAEYTVLISVTTLLISTLSTFFDNLTNLRNLCLDAGCYYEYQNAVKEKSTISKSNDLSNVEIDYANAEIKFNNVCFKYPGSDKYALQNINLCIKPSVKYALVGVNGSGKTTLVNLLSRLYDPDEGSITMGDIPITNIPYSSYIRHIGIVLQNFMLFPYSVKENIAFDLNADNAKINEVIDWCDLGKKSDSLPHGIDTIIGKQLSDEGIEFSGGEGQKLAIARQVYKNTPLIITDEPTSALDPLNEERIYKRLNALLNDKTSLYISHRLSSTRFCDEVIVLDKGKVVEIGKPDELLEKQGIYAELFNSQAKFYRNTDCYEKGNDI